MNSYCTRNGHHFQCNSIQVIHVSVRFQAGAVSVHQFGLNRALGLLSNYFLKVGSFYMQMKGKPVQ